MLRFGRDGVGCQHFCICRPGRVNFCWNLNLRTVLTMGRADYTEKSVEENGSRAVYGAEVLDARGKSPAQPRVQSEWPLSFAQQRLWFVEQLEPGKSAYNMPLVARLTGTFNLSVFQRALDAVVRRHESLRTRFVCVNGRPAQVVDNGCGLKVRVADLSGLAVSEKEVESKRRIREEINHPFNLSEAPLVRVLVLR